MSTVDTLIEKQESIAFPKETFDFGCGPSAEEKECVGNEEIHMEPVFDYGCERIDPVS